MDGNVLDIFSPYSEAVIAIKDGKTVYLNDSAKKLFGGKGPAAEDFSPLFFGGEQECIAGTVTVNGTDYAAVSKAWLGYTVISVFRTDDMHGDRLPNMLEALLGNIKSELAVIQMSMGLIKNRLGDKYDKKLEQYRAMTLHSYNKLLRMVNNASRVYLWDGENEKLSVSCFDIAELIGNLVDSVNYLTDDRLSITFESSSSEYLFFGDADKIETLVLNLLSNSIKYTDADGTIRVSLKGIQKGIVLSVSDTGRGIKPDVLSSVFSRYNERIKTDDIKEGIGFGLPIVQRIVAMHGGSVALESREGEGTTVKVFLPDKKYEDAVHDNEAVYESSMNSILTEFSDVIGADKYITRDAE